MVTKIISFNVNGIRSILTKEKDGTKHKEPITNNSVSTLLDDEAPDVLCLQEIRCSASLDISKHLDLQAKGYYIIGQNCSKSKAGYSGTLVIAKQQLPVTQAITTIQDFPHLPSTHELNQEGRVITVEFPKFILINVYVPNSKPDLSRLTFRVSEWETNIRKHITNMKQRFSNKPIIMCGDLNVAPNPIDLHNAKQAKGKHGFTEEERQAFTTLLEECELVDAYRHLHPTKTDDYSWWSNFAKSRERNKGWRIDIHVVSASIAKKIKEAKIQQEYHGSDHAPISLSIAL
jgi:exodeoxyribonuclease III